MCVHPYSDTGHYMFELHMTAQSTRFVFIQLSYSCAFSADSRFSFDVGFPSLPESLQAVGQELTPGLSVLASAEQAAWGCKRTCCKFELLIKLLYCVVLYNLPHSKRLSLQPSDHVSTATSSLTSPFHLQYRGFFMDYIRILQYYGSHALPVLR